MSDDFYSTKIREVVAYYKGAINFAMEEAPLPTEDCQRDYYEIMGILLQTISQDLSEKTEDELIEEAAFWALTINKDK